MDKLNIERMIEEYHEDEVIKRIKEEYSKKKEDNIVYLLFPESIDFRGVQIGDRWFFEAMYIIEHTWNQIKPFCEFAGMTVGAASFCVKIISYIKAKQRKKCKDIFGMILSRETWDIDEAENILKLDRDDCKKLIKLFGYKWDNHRRKYIRTFETDDIIQILNIKK